MEIRLETRITKEGLAHGLFYQTKGYNGGTEWELIPGATLGPRPDNGWIEILEWAEDLIEHSEQFEDIKMNLEQAQKDKFLSTPILRANFDFISELSKVRLEEEEHDNNDAH